MDLFLNSVVNAFFFIFFFSLKAAYAFLQIGKKSIEFGCLIFTAQMIGFRCSPTVLRISEHEDLNVILARRSDIEFLFSFFFSVEEIWQNMYFSCTLICMVLE